MSELSRQPMITSGMMQPMAKMLRLEYSSQVVQQPAEGVPQTSSVVNVTFRTPSGGAETRQYSDGPYVLSNQHLQLMAAIGHQPTDYDGMSLDVSDEDVVVPVVYNQSDGPMGGWHISQAVFERGRQALEVAEWNSFGDDSSAVTVNIGGSDQ